jgi:hypothetical protein
MAMTNYLRKKLGDHAIGKATFTMPTVHLGLFTDSPGSGGSLTNEVTGGSYARIEVTSKMGAFDLVTGIATSSALIEFATPTANWGTVTHVGIMDASSSGNVLIYDELPVPRSIVNAGRKVTFTTGTLSIAL